ncbi:MAG: hypothetical protein GY821_07445, partial [Gammaproteobacteria bacterium]|nr:hypothetical protein [Gammaproteobacteria bacterium]
MDFEEQGFEGNFVLDDEGGDLYRIENNEGQYQNQNNGQNRGNQGQNHNRSNYKPPSQLCRRFGLHNDSSFDTFEFDFQLACEMYQIPSRERVNWLLMHLEGSIKEHARSWMKDRGLTNKPTYEELVEELRPSFQQEMTKEIAERKLVGRKWNMFTSIDTFLHETRELVQCALPGLIQQWPDRIRSCLMQALPSSWDQSLSCSDKSYQQIVQWIRAQTAKIQNTPQEEWEDWIKQAYRQNQKGGGVPNLSVNFKGTPNVNPPPKCYTCGEFGLRSTVCGRQQ